MVGVEGNTRRPSFCVPKHHRARLGQAIGPYCGQHRGTPLMVTIVRGTLQFYPNAMANLLVSLNERFHSQGAAGRSKEKLYDIS